MDLQDLGPAGGASAGGALGGGTGGGLIDGGGGAAGGGGGGLTAGIQRIGSGAARTRSLVMGVEQDMLIPLSEQRHVAEEFANIAMEGGQRWEE